MMNLSNTAPPETVEINGTDYPINYDFRVWADISIKLKDIISEPQTNEDEINNFETIREIELLAFGEMINEDWLSVISAVIEFMNGYPKEDNGYHSSDEDDTPLYSLQHDMNYIVLAIRNQSGIDLSYRREEPFHWWLFLLEFQTLSSGHYICGLMRRRSYKGDDRELLDSKKAVELPKEYTKSEKRLIETIDEMFYNT